MAVWGGLTNSCEKKRSERKRSEKQRTKGKIYTHLNAEFQRIARRDKNAFLSDQGKEIEENNRIGKTKHLFKKTRDTKGTFHAISVQFSRSVMSNSLRPHEPQHARPPCPSPTPRVHPNPRPLNQWCHPTISSSVIPFSSCPQSFPASGSFPVSQLFASGGQTTGVAASTSVLPMNTHDSFPLGWTGWIALQSKGLSRVFSNTIVQKHQLFCVQLSQ